VRSSGRSPVTGCRASRRAPISAQISTPRSANPHRSQRRGSAQAQDVAQVRLYRGPPGAAGATAAVNGSAAITCQVRHRSDRPVPGRARARPRKSSSDLQHIERSQLV
jgi:hypothetical protein